MHCLHLPHPFAIQERRKSLFEVVLSRSLIFTRSFGDMASSAVGSRRQSTTSALLTPPSPCTVDQEVGGLGAAPAGLPHSPSASGVSPGAAAVQAGHRLLW